MLGHGKARLWDSKGGNALRLDRLLSSNVSEDEKREIVGRLMVRRVSGLKINGQLYTKNLYRREWRQGGYRVHDEPMRIVDQKQRLVVGLMQKKVAEILRDERFKNSFQIGMLSSFESFLETVGRRARQMRCWSHPTSTKRMASPRTSTATKGTPRMSAEGSTPTRSPRWSSRIDRGFTARCPTRSLSSTADSFAAAFETGDKVLIFVRRVRTVDELAAKLNTYFESLALWPNDGCPAGARTKG